MATKKVIHINKGAPRAAATPSQPAATVKPSKPTPKRRSRGSSLAPLYIIVAVVIAIAGGAFYSSQKKAKEERVIAMNVRKLIADAAVQAEEITGICRTVIALSPHTDGLIEATKAAVQTVIEKDITRSLRRQTGTPVAPPPAASNGGKSTKPGTPSAPAPAADSGMQHGILSPEALAAKHARAAERQPEKPADDAAPAAGPTLSMSSRPGLRKKRVDPPIWVAGRVVCDGVEEVLINAALAKDLIKLTADELEETRNDFFLESVKQRVGGFAARKQEAEELLAAAKQGLQQAKAAKLTVEQLKTAHIEAERERLAEEKRAREAADRQQTAARELATATTAVTAMETFFAPYRYEKALAQGEAVLATLTDPAARKACALEVDRYTELVKMKQYMITRLNKAPLRWGWRQDKPMRDIVGADRDLVKTLGRDIPWEKVGPAQFEYMVKQFFANERTAPSVKAEYGLGVALYYLKRGNEKEAKFYANRSIIGRGSSRDEVRRLIPIAD